MPMLPVTSVDGQTAEANVEVVEPMGSEVFVYMSTGPHNFQARLNSRTHAKPGDKMTVGFDLQHLHLFDKATQLTMLSRQALQRPNR